MTVAQALPAHLGPCFETAEARITLRFKGVSNPSRTFTLEEKAGGNKRERWSPLLEGTIEGIYEHGLVVKLDVGYRTFVSWVDLWLGLGPENAKGGVKIEGPRAARDGVAFAVRGVKGSTQWGLLGKWSRDQDEVDMAAGGAGS